MNTHHWLQLTPDPGGYEVRWLDNETTDRGSRKLPDLLRLTFVDIQIIASDPAIGLTDDQHIAVLAVKIGLSATTGGLRAGGGVIWVSKPRFRSPGWSRIAKPDTSDYRQAYCYVGFTAS